MKIFTNQKIFKKLLIVLIAIMLFSVVVPPKVTYAASDDIVSTVGGALLSPVASLIIGIGDVLINIVHKALFDIDSAQIIASTSADWWRVVVTIGVYIVVAAAVFASLYFGGGWIVGKLAASGLLAAGSKLTVMSVLVMAAASSGTGAFVAYQAWADWFGDYYVFPVYLISPEEIFKNEVDLLDINFFKPKTKVDKTIKASEEKFGNNGQFPLRSLKNLDESSYQSGCLDMEFVSGIVPNDRWREAREGSVVQDTTDTYYQYATPYLELTKLGTAQYKLSFYQDKAKNNSVLKKELDNILSKMKINPDEVPSLKNGSALTLEIALKGIGQLDRSQSIVINVGQDIDDDGDFDIEWGYYGYDTFTATARIDGEIIAKVEQIFLYRQVESTEMDIDGEYEGKLSYIIYEKIQEGTITEETKLVSLGAQLKGTVSKWYYAIRNFVLVVMMLILVYIGIRIIISGISSEKAKYKNMLIDWIVAVCLVFVMHYIMVFALNVVEGIINMCDAVVGDANYIYYFSINQQGENNAKEAFKEAGLSFDEYLLKYNGEIAKADDGNKVVVWDAKNLMGRLRIETAQTNKKDLLYLGYAIMYLILIWYTLYFLFTYLRRALYITFFTIIAPLVAMTYPIDKLHDGKAQAFNMWLREYIFNLLIQPVHLLLYTILIGMAWELAQTNPIYTLVAMGFMMPAEKFIRKMFGFNKAETPGFLGGAVGAGVMMGLANKVFHKKPSKGQNEVNDENKSGKEDKIKMKDDSCVDPLLLAAGLGDDAAGGNTGSGNAGKGIKVVPRPVSKENNSGVKKPTPVSEGTKKADITTSETSTKPKATTIPSKTTPSKKSGFWRGIKGATTAYKRQKLKRLGNNIVSGKSIRDLAKFSGGLFLGATGAVLGASLGISSGELKNVAGYGTTLGAGGYALGSRDIKIDPDLEHAYEEYERGKYGSEEEYRRHLLEEQRRQVINNDQNVEQVRTYLGLDDSKQAREYMEQYGDCIDAGITNMEDLSTIVQLVEEQGWEKANAITAATYYKKAGGKPKNMGKKDRENIEFQYRNIVRANGVTDEEKVDNCVQEILRNLDTYGSTKDNLTKV